MTGHIFFLVIILTTTAIVIEQPKQHAILRSQAGLQFTNFSGSGVTKEHITAFINYANSASSFYKDDVEANAKYIKEKMDQQFGDPSQNLYFFVAIQTDEVPTSYHVWVASDSLYGQLSGINKVNPSWSYFFVRFYSPLNDPGYVLVKEGSKGYGITAEIEKSLRNAVTIFETGSTCRCQIKDTGKIGEQLIQTRKQAWSTICSASPNINAYVSTIRGLWIHTKPKSCYYTFFVSV